MSVYSVQRYDFSDIIDDDNRKLVLIIYDIIDNKRRLAMVKLLESYGRRVQKSAFEAVLTNRMYSEVISGIRKIITEEDNVRMYRLNSSNEILLIGTSDTVYNDENNTFFTGRKYRPDIRTARRSAAAYYKNIQT